MARNHRTETKTSSLYSGDAGLRSKTLSEYGRVSFYLYFMSNK